MREILKKIIPIIFSFVLILSSCFVSSASNSHIGPYGSIDLTKVILPYELYIKSSSDGLNFKEKYYYFDNLECSSPVYLYVSYSNYFSSNGNPQHYYWINLISANDFKIDVYEGSSLIKSLNATLREDGFYYNYVASSSGSNHLDILSTIACLSQGENTSPIDFANQIVLPAIKDGVIDNTVEIIKPIEKGYASQPTGEITPPQNFSIYRGYSNADKQYKFQMQWDKPTDTDLNVEVMYNIHYKDGPLGFGSHIYEKYLHITHVDGHSAQTNKIQYLEDDLLKAYFESKKMDLPSVYNITEIYVRFSKEIDGVINYSLWRKIEYLNLDVGNGFDATEDDFDAESSTGAFDTSDNWIDQSVSNGEIVNGSDKENAKAPGLDVNGDNITDVTSPIVNPNIWDSDLESVFGSFKNAIKSAITFVGEFPSMVSEFFGFLPSWVVGCISIGLVMAVLLRLLGR